MHVRYRITICLLRVTRRGSESMSTYLKTSLVILLSLDRPMGDQVIKKNGIID